MASRGAPLAGSLLLGLRQGQPEEPSPGPGPRPCCQCTRPCRAKNRRKSALAPHRRRLADKESNLAPPCSGSPGPFTASMRGHRKEPQTQQFKSLSERLRSSVSRGLTMPSRQPSGPNQHLAHEDTRRMPTSPVLLGCPCTRGLWAVWNHTLHPAWQGNWLYPISTGGKGNEGFYEGQAVHTNLDGMLKSRDITLLTKVQKSKLRLFQ